MLEYPGSALTSGCWLRLPGDTHPERRQRWPRCSARTPCFWPGPVLVITGVWDSGPVSGSFLCVPNYYIIYKKEKKGQADSVALGHPSLSSGLPRHTGLCCDEWNWVVCWVHTLDSSSVPEAEGGGTSGPRKEESVGQAACGAGGKADSAFCLSPPALARCSFTFWTLHLKIREKQMGAKGGISKPGVQGCKGRKGSRPGVPSQRASGVSLALPRALPHPQGTEGHDPRVLWVA